MLPRNSIEFYPVAYVRELKNAGLNDMRMAFLMYWDDYCDGDLQADRYYATLWSSHSTRARASKKKGMSPSTASAWIRKFREVIDNFEAFKTLNDRAAKSTVDTFAKNKIGQIGHGQLDTVGHSEHTGNWAFDGGSENRIGHGEGTELDDIYNNNNTNTQGAASDGEFFYLYQTCRMANKNVGSMEGAFAEWKKLEGIGWRDLAIAYLLYMKDRVTHSDRPYGLMRFIQNGIYLSYTMPYVKVTGKDGKEQIGYYDITAGLLANDEGKPFGQISRAAFMAMISEGRIEYLGKYMAKAK